jgi:ATP-dependent protease HslVU (ClpYQ) peptidase subunit
MTCIVGLVHDNKVIMGADSAAVAGGDIRQSGTAKLFQKGPFLIGYTTSFRMGQILHYMIDFPETDKHDEEYMVTKFIEAVRIKFKELGYSRIDSNEESGGSFLVGVAGKLYEIASDFQVQSFPDGMYAIGCGFAYAQGAMHAREYDNPETRIYAALRAAAYFSNGVCGPFTVLASTEAANG